MFILRILCLLLTLSAMSAQAADTPRVQLTALRVHATQNGGQTEERLVPAAALQPGDVVEYQAVYTNGAAASAQAVLLTVPVPAGAVYIERGARPAGAQGSVDGKTFAALPLVRLQTLPDGRQVQRPVPAAEVRYLRWNLGDLPAGATRTVHARVQVPALDGSVAITALAR